MDRRSFFPAILGLAAIPRVLQRAPLPTDDVQVVSVPYVATPNAIGPASDYTITTAASVGTGTVSYQYWTEGEGWQNVSASYAGEDGWKMPQFPLHDANGNPIYISNFRVT